MPQLKRKNVIWKVCYIDVMRYQKINACIRRNFSAGGAILLKDFLFMQSGKRLLLKFQPGSYFSFNMWDKGTVLFVLPIYRCKLFPFVRSYVKHCLLMWICVMSNYRIMQYAWMFYYMYDKGVLVMLLECVYSVGTAYQ